MKSQEITLKTPYTQQRWLGFCLGKRYRYKPSSFPVGISDIEPEESFLQRDRLALPGPWPRRFLWRTMNPPIP